MHWVQDLILSAATNGFFAKLIAQLRKLTLQISTA